MMLKIERNEKGSISLFVLLSALFFLVVVTSVGISFKNKEASIDAQFEKIKTSYEKDVGNEEQVYNEEIKKKTVTFNPNGGNVDITSKVVKLGETYGELPIPTRDGYTFKGWNGKNLFNEENIILDSYTDKSGNVKEYHNNTTPWNCSEYIEIEGGKTYTFNPNSTKGNNDTAHCIYDSEKNFLSSVNTGLATMVMPENAKYVIVSFRSTTASSNPSSNIQLEESSTATEYEPYFVTSSTKVTQNNGNRYVLTAIWEENT